MPGCDDAAESAGGDSDDPPAAHQLFFAIRIQLPERQAIRQIGAIRAGVAAATPAAEPAASAAAAPAGACHEPLDHQAIGRALIVADGLQLLLQIGDAIFRGNDHVCRLAGYPPAKSSPAMTVRLRDLLRGTRLM